MIKQLKFILLGATVATLVSTAVAEKGVSFSIIVLPDTQYYSESYPQHFAAQTQWIKDNVKELNIQYVLHLGDLTDNGTTNEWDVARAAMDTLNGVVPYALTTGNHDFVDVCRKMNRNTLFNNSNKDIPAYFGPGTPYATQASIGGFYPDKPDQTENSWHTFHAMGEDFLILTLEWGPRNLVVEWADAVVQNHPNHHVILITHAYMNHDDNRYNWAEKGKAQSWNPHSYSTARLPGGTNDGEELWQKLVKKHGNFMMTINGHVLSDGAAFLTSTGDHGNEVHQMLANYQTAKEGGSGYLRILTFKENKETIEVQTYSPVLDTFDTRAHQQFTFRLSPVL